MQPRILTFDRLVSLFLYFVAATSIGDVVGLELRSLLAVGGVSGIPNFQLTEACMEWNVNLSAWVDGWLAEMLASHAPHLQLQV